MQDTLLFQGMRRRMIEKLAEVGIHDAAILQALYAVPRHFFVPKGLEHLAYKNRALKIKAEQTISQPLMVAYQTQLLKIKAGDKVLEIGTGSGYQASILAALGVNVYTVERIQQLFENAQTLFNLLGYSHIQMKYGDGFEGWQEQAPFDKIIVTAAAPEIPQQLIEQLKIGGRMVIPVGAEDKVQELYLVVRTSANQFKSQVLEKVRFVPMLKGLRD